MKKEIKLALLAILTIALSVWGFQFISGKNFLSGDLIFYGIYNNVQDVTTATKVQINGVVVGSVISIKPEPENVRNIKLGFTVNKDIKLPKDVIAELRASSPIGGKMIELVFDKMCSGSNCLENGSILEARTLGLLSSLVSPSELEPHVKSLNAVIDSTLGQLGNPNSNDPLDVSINKLSETMQNFSSLTAKMNRLMTNSSKNLEITMANTAVLTESLVQSQAQLGSILSNLNTVTNDLSKVKISDSMTKANGTIDQAQASLKGVEMTMAEATNTLTELKTIMSNLENGKGTLGKLMADEELYNNLSESTREMDLLLQDIRLNPRRYFKLFGKKVPAYVVPEDDPALKK